MEIQKINPRSKAYPSRLRRLPQPPAQLFWRGSDPADLLGRPCLAVVGSRNFTAYGHETTRALVRDLSRAGVVIISGLALGIDSIAHLSALEVDGATIAVLPTAISRVYPARNAHLARRIVERGGALVSEYDTEVAQPFPFHFIARNRIIAGLANAVLITEGAEKSGSLHTARFALEQGKDVLAVPGNITSRASVGTNNLIKAGAVPVTSASDILNALGITHTRFEARKPKGDSPAEQLILDLIGDGVSEAQELLAVSKLDAAHFNRTLTMLEIGGSIYGLGANRWALR